MGVEDSPDTATNCGVQIERTNKVQLCWRVRELIYNDAFWSIKHIRESVLRHCREGSIEWPATLKDTLVHVDQVLTLLAFYVYAWHTWIGLQRNYLLFGLKSYRQRK